MATPATMTDAAATMQAITTPKMTGSDSHNDSTIPATPGTMAARYTDCHALQ